MHSFYAKKTIRTLFILLLCAIGYQQIFCMNDTIDYNVENLAELIAPWKTMKEIIQNSIIEAHRSPYKESELIHSEDKTIKAVFNVESELVTLSNTNIQEAITIKFFLACLNHDKKKKCISQ